MPTYLQVPFPEKDAAKALGARWDGAQRQWYVPDGIELALFASWLPAGAEVSKVARDVTLLDSRSTDLALPKKGITLSALLGGVSTAVAQAYRSGVWTLVEVVELRSNGGHVYMGVSERDARGVVVAKTSAVIWQSTANTILPEFERATGAQLAPGIKLLVRARPVFKAQHGFSLEIDGIDPEYTLGDLEARKRDIRARLQLEGVFAANKALPAPWDYSNVLVVAPEGGAGLGDFQGEADRLQRHGVCQFTYVFSRFQGEGAARDISDALQTALGQWKQGAATGSAVSTSPAWPDAVVIIRGGGAVNDLAWLNDYDLARTICDLPIPVLTGIGHERDSTLIDEVAHQKFDTPSKVIAGIEQVIARRVAEVKVNFEWITRRATMSAQSVRAQIVTLEREVRSNAVHHLAQGRQSTTEMFGDLRLQAAAKVRAAGEQSRDALQFVRTQSATHMERSRRDVPALWREITLGASHSIRSAMGANKALFTDVLERAHRDLNWARVNAQETLEATAVSARRILQDADTASQSLMREIAGQGPEKTLKRGFAVVRISSGQALTRAAQAPVGGELEIQFQDGMVRATTNTQ